MKIVKRAGVRLAGAYDQDKAAISLLREAHPGIQAFDTLDQLLADPSIGLVYDTVQVARGRFKPEGRNRRKRWCYVSHDRHR